LIIDETENLHFRLNNYILVFRNSLFRKNAVF